MVYSDGIFKHVDDYIEVEIIPVDPGENPLTYGDVINILDGPTDFIMLWRHSDWVPTFDIEYRDEKYQKDPTGKGSFVIEQWEGITNKTAITHLE